MKKSLLFFVALLLVYGNVVYAEAPSARTHSNKLSTHGNSQIKFGPQVGANLISRRIGAFVEYKWNEALGVQVAPTYFRNAYFLNSLEVSNGKAALAQTSCISIPVVIRCYPGKDRQFCWVGGIQLGYVVGGKFTFASKAFSSSPASDEDVKQIKKDFEKNVYVDLKEISEKDQLRKIQVGIVVGFDYEFDFGLLLGLHYSRELIDVIKCKASFLNWSLQPTLGFNFGRFLN